MVEKRKGARSFKELDLTIVDSLNKGELETVNLTEWLAVDQKLLLGNFLNEIGRESYLEPILKEIDKLEKISSNTLIHTIGSNLLLLIDQNSDFELIEIMSTHVSDIIRCWATYIVGSNSKLSLSDKLEQVKPFAADSHFGVREEAWMAVRNSIADDLGEAIEILEEWTKSDNEYVRRFATESTRPRGVWCKHIEELKEKPELTLCLLEPLRSDSSKYVRDSVANWINDASKSQPQFALDLCSRWEKESITKETAYIVKRSLRSLNKN